MSVLISQPVGAEELKEVPQIKCHNIAKPKEIRVVEDMGWKSKFSRFLVGKL